jgi:hypothetical protein
LQTEQLDVEEEAHYLQAAGQFKQVFVVLSLKVLESKEEQFSVHYFKA